jgi:quercetin dioxygenase-like cupin family protein
MKGMKISHYTEVPAENPAGETKGVTVRWVISEEDEAPNFFMRLFEIAPGGHTPLHSHAWEHGIYVLTGEGEVIRDEGNVPIKPGTTIYIPGGESHQFMNPGDQVLRFICIIPSSGT